MRLCTSVFLLLVLLQSWTTAHPRPDHHGTDHGADHGTDHGTDHGSKECKVISAMSMKDITPFLGRFNFLVGFTNNPLYKTILNLTSSYWYNATEIQTGVGLAQFNKMNGTCVTARMNATIDEHTATVKVDTITSAIQFVKISKTLMIMNITASSPDMANFIRKLNLNPAEFSSTLSVHSFYLMSRDTEVSEEDLQLFKEHAKCAGFTGEPDYIHQPQQGFCSVEEAVPIHI